MDGCIYFSSAKLQFISLQTYLLPWSIVFLGCPKAKPIHRMSNKECFIFICHPYFHCLYVLCVSDPRALNSAMESVLHWACKSEKENEVLVELLLPKFMRKWDLLYCLPNMRLSALSKCLCVWPLKSPTLVCIDSMSWSIYCLNWYGVSYRATNM